MPLTDNDCKFLTAEIAHVRNTVDEIKRQLEANFVTKSEFAPVQKIVYGLVGLLLLAAMSKLVIK